MLDKILKIIGLIHPTTKQIDILLTLVVIVVLLVTLKFFLAGITITYGVHSITFGQTDAFGYGSVMSPILAAHGFNSTRNSTYGNLGDAPTRWIPDNPEDDV